LLFFLASFLISCQTDFGERYTLGNLEIYFTKDVSKKYVEGVGKYFEENNLILDTKHAVQLTSDNKSFILKMILKTGLSEFPPNEESTLRWMEADIKEKVFEGLNFRIEVCDGNFNTLATAN